MDWCAVSARMTDREKAPSGCGVEGNPVHPVCPRTILGGSAWSSRGMYRKRCVHRSTLYLGLAWGTYCCFRPGKPQRAKACKGGTTPRSRAEFQIGFLWGSRNSKVVMVFSNPPMKGIASFLPASSSLPSCYEVHNPARPYNRM